MIKAKQFKELGPPEDVEYIERERHAVAIHEACHAVIAYRTRQHMEIDIATIEKGSNYLGMVSSIKPEDQFTRWRSEYESDILVALASLAGERMFFDSDSSSGVSGDLDSATTVASYMEGYWGMGKTVSSPQAARRLEGGTPGGARAAAGRRRRPRVVPGIQKLADRIEDNLGGCWSGPRRSCARTSGTCSRSRTRSRRHKTLSGEDVTAVFDGGRGPLVDGAPYADDAFIDRLREYHLAAAPRAPRAQPAAMCRCRSPTPAYAIGYGAGDLYGTNGNGERERTASSTAPRTGTAPERSRQRERVARAGRRADLEPARTVTAASQP